jgi:O-methyltransferase involved in polyketide biosynthesis
LGYSVFDTRWIDDVLNYGVRPTLFLAEGLFMYLPEEDVKALVLELQQRFPGCELACEVVHKAWVKGIWGKIRAYKMHKELKLGKTAAYYFGIDTSREPETWHSGIELLEEWSYFDTQHPKLGLLKLFARVDWLRRIQWTAHYRLN